MDLGPVDARLLPLLPLPDAWVVLAEAPPERAPGSAALMATDEAGTLVLAGVEVPGGAWAGAEVDVATVGGVRCAGRIDRVAEAAWLRWSRPEGLEGCADLTCPDALATAAWELPGPHLVVGHLDSALRCTGREGWARSSAAGALELVPARPVAEDGWVNRALATFRRLPSWAAVQARWLSEVGAPDAAEWDEAGGAVPEVARFSPPVGPPLVTVAAQTGERCGAGFAAELSAVFEQREGPTGPELVPLAGDRTSAPGFAPTVLTLSDGVLRFAAPGRAGGTAGAPVVDARPRSTRPCP